jgi:hypothetical protein
VRIEKQEISFHIKKSLGMRKGWKIIAHDGEMIDGAALKTVVSMIKDMECQVSKNISDCIISCTISRAVLFRTESLSKLPEEEIFCPNSTSTLLAALFTISYSHVHIYIP